MEGNRYKNVVTRTLMCLTFALYFSSTIISLFLATISCFKLAIWMHVNVWTEFIYLTYVGTNMFCVALESRSNTQCTLYVKIALTYTILNTICFGVGVIVDKHNIDCPLLFWNCLLIMCSRTVLNSIIIFLFKMQQIGVLLDRKSVV